MIILTLCVFFVCPSCIFDPKCFSRKTPIWKLWTNLLQWVKSYGKHVKNLWTKNNGKWHSVIAMQMRKMRNSHNQKKNGKIVLKWWRNFVFSKIFDIHWAWYFGLRFLSDAEFYSDQNASEKKGSGSFFELHFFYWILARCGTKNIIVNLYDVIQNIYLCWPEELHKKKIINQKSIFLVLYKIMFNSI